jgi:serine/threonine-protein kinase RsbW
MIGGRVRVLCLEDLGTSVAAMVTRLAEAAGMTHSQTYRLRLATEELVTNIVTHGYGGHGGPIDIDGGFEEDWVWLRLEDDAPEFDPTEYDPVPRLTQDPSLAPLGGFGLFLALTSVDRFEHAYTGGRNRNLLKIRRDGGTHGEATSARGG